MTLQRKDALWAAGAISAAGAITGGTGNFTVAGPAASVFTITLSEAIDAGECVFIATIRGNGGQDGMITTQHTSDTVKLVNTFDDAGVAEDHAFDFAIWRVS